ncbi:adhesion G protein-coupled receptor A3 isoform X2 [Physeter macrocephalus]|uniref:Adhesion G protein-coupled receptor A3 n=2 Tax=Physeter macrocephalus TaxID=9755 RepID=A0A2Y9F628_PHYMC|nr:adhesion G protein-coupled receptor A3 isoform X2 [Physeter catodon]|eukprot:XP_007115906.2 adhesion G protein-coupled receptor A3 isoform X1 [Physeter catodon]
MEPSERLRGRAPPPLLLPLALLALLGGGGGAAALPPGCKHDGRPRGAGRAAGAAEGKVVCSSLELAQVLPPDTLPNRTVTLILSNNKISELKNGSFSGLSLLERLDLRNNLISSIDPGAFWGLSSLKRLDLTNNRIGCLNADIFRGLTNLVRLNLSGNLFSSLSQGTFDYLGSLRSLEFQTEYLLCDCNILWMHRWVKERNITVRDTRCVYPKSLQAQPVTGVKQELLTCDPPLELPSFYMTPSHRQVVFEGDSLPFQCMASYIDQDMQVLWYQDGRIVETDESQGIFVEKNMIHNCSLIASALTISNIQAGSTGNWGCHVQSKRGNNTRTVDIVVLESSAQYCPPERVVNNKGDFRWPRTLAGITAHLQCTRNTHSGGIYPGNAQDERKAWRRCDRGGFWADDDYSRCQYANDVTRVLYMFNQMPLNLTNAVATARQLLAYTVEAANFSDKMDVIFVAEMIEKFGRFTKEEKSKELGDVMVDIASNIMLADDRVLGLAQREAKACSRIVQCLQRIATYRLANGAHVYSTYSPNIALEAYVIKAAGFTGMTCTVFQKVAATDRTGFSDYGRRDPDGNLDKQLSFKCNVSNTFSSLALKNTIVEASIQLPPSLFSPKQKREVRPSDDSLYKLQLIAFRNGKLFPATGNSTNLADDGKRRTVVTPVILTKLDGVNIDTHHIPVNVTLRRIAHGADPVAAQWDFDLLNGQGGWTSDGCRILCSDENITTIQCYSLSNYAVLMDLTGSELYTQAANLLHPVVYTTAVILLFCLLVVIVSYIYHHSLIRISLKGWHMLVNLCFHIFLTCVIFVGGVTQTRNASVCQAVGIILHYSTLATVLWVGVTARNIYKQVTRKAKRCQDPDELPPPPRPMLRFYLIGGGIPVIVCGITAAANIKNYGSRPNAPYCWMAWEPSLGAFYGPASFITFVNCMYFLSIFIQLKRHPERKYELKEPSEEPRRLAANENGEANHQDSLSLSLISTSALENEHTFHSQLLGASLTLLLYVALWMFGALAVSLYYPLDLVFSFFFGATCLSLSAFIVVHHCVNREDVRLAWIMTCCPGRSAYSVQVNVQPPSSSGPNGEAPKCTNSSTESSCTNKSASSFKNSSQGCKLTNLQAAAAQCHTNSLPLNATPQLDNSLTEHSMDNDIKMHVAPLEVPFRTNVHPSRHHKNRSKGHRASRLTVLREYAYDVPTSVEGSVQNGLSKSRPGSNEGHSRSRRAYLAYRERQYNPPQQDSSDACSTLPKSSRNFEKPVSTSSKKDALRKPTVVELESQQKSYGLNLAIQNGPVKSTGQDGPLLGMDSTGNVRTGLWKHETTV